MTKNPSSSLMRPYTDAERQHLNETLSRPLGPEYLSYRNGSFGRLTYITGGAAVQLANEIFGFDGWSTEIKNTTIDYVDVCEGNKVNVGVSVTMRITLKDGTYREDIGYGASENARNKGTGIEKAKKHATTDAVKRTLRNFGNALGNCMYEKSYLDGILKMGNPQVKFSPANLYRHEQYRPKDTPVTPQPLLNAPQQPAQRAQKQYIPAPTVNTSPQRQQRQAKTENQACQVQPLAQAQAQAQQKTLSLAQKRHQEQIEMQQKRAKQNHNRHDNKIKEELDTIAPVAQPALLPEESFSYEGDDEFYAMFQEDGNEDEFIVNNEDEFDNIDDAAIVELDRVSQTSNQLPNVLGTN